MKDTDTLPARKFILQMRNNKAYPILDPRVNIGGKVRSLADSYPHKFVFVAFNCSLRSIVQVCKM